MDWWCRALPGDSSNGLQDRSHWGLQVLLAIDPVLEPGEPRPVGHPRTGKWSIVDWVVGQQRRHCRTGFHLLNGQSTGMGAQVSGPEW